jgi:SAM-dependent methyltransferase
MHAKLTKYRIRCAKKLFGKILDIGAGEGAYSGYFGSDFVSLDMDFENLKNLSGYKIMASAARLPFPANTFDCVWSCAVLEHVETNFIPEAIRVTKSGGVIYILTPNRYSPYDPLKRLFGYGDWWSNEGHVRLYSVRELRTFGKVWGEVWWAPVLDNIARIIPSLGHTLMLRIDVTADIKKRYITNDQYL